MPRAAFPGCADGKVFIDAGITVSRPRILKEASSLSGDPIKHVINAHWHFDHTDINQWLNAEGAAIIAHENTHKHLLVAERAEAAARDLLGRFPDVHDGWDRLGMVHQARGDSRQAADCYRKVIAFIKDHPDDYEPSFEEVFVKRVDRLDPPTET